MLANLGPKPVGESQWMWIGGSPEVTVALETSVYRKLSAATAEECPYPQAALTLLPVSWPPLRQSRMRTAIYRRQSMCSSRERQRIR
jgi:hypothetical protein